MTYGATYQGRQVMDMTELIESIDRIEQPCLVRITKETYELQESGNNRPVAFNDFHNAIYTKEDAMAALFDADIYGWSIRAVNWCNSCSNGLPYPWLELEVTLFKTN